MIKKIYLDLDGVLVDFVRGAAKVFDEDYDELMKRWPPGCFDMELVLGIEKNKFFSRLEEVGESFWSELPPYPYCFDFYEYCRKIAPTYFLTAPTQDPGCLSGKMKWLHKHFGRSFRNFIIAPHKGECAGDGKVLIDDRESNIVDFVKCGGKAIMWPAVFNPRYAEADNCVDVVKRELETLR